MTRRVCAVVLLEYNEIQPEINFTRGKEIKWELDCHNVFFIVNLLLLLSASFTLLCKPQNIDWINQLLSGSEDLSFCFWRDTNLGTRPAVRKLCLQATVAPERVISMQSGILWMTLSPYSFHC